jgi:hypothetical protein
MRCTMLYTGSKHQGKIGEAARDTQPYYIKLLLQFHRRSQKLTFIRAVPDGFESNGKEKTRV